MGFLSKTLRICIPSSLACLLAVTIEIFFFSPIDPNLLQLPPKSSLISTKDTRLQGITKLGEGFLEKPEDVCVDKHGVVYTATRDGWIKRLYKNGSMEDWKMINNSTTLLGITLTKDGSLVVCDAEEGLLKVNEQGITVLTSHFNGSKIRLADDVIEAEDGSLYFSAASTKFGLHDWYLDVLEAKPHGQLLKYDPSLNQTSIVLNNLAFANGVALSKEQDFLIVCESWKFRCLKHWLKGNSQGQTEIFVENLPGGPDNINLAPDGSFWIALIQVTIEGLEFVHTSKPAKHLVATFPKLTQLFNGAYKAATVINVADDGKIMKVFGDYQGNTISFVTSAFEFEDNLYLGSLNSNFIGKLSLKAA